MLGYRTCCSQGFWRAWSPGAGKWPSACPSTEPTQTCPPQGLGKEGQRMSWSCQDLTSSAKTGRKMMIVAVLLANSVNKAMTTVMRMTATGGGTPSKGCRRPPIHTDKPDSCKGESENSNHPPASLQGPGALLEPVLRVSHSKQLAGSCTPLSYVLCIAVTWGWEICPVSVMTPLIQVFQSPVRMPSDTLM